jgi:hypothetical protein
MIVFGNSLGRRNVGKKGHKPLESRGSGDIKTWRKDVTAAPATSRNGIRLFSIMSVIELATTFLQRGLQLKNSVICVVTVLSLFAATSEAIRVVHIGPERERFTLVPLDREGAGPSGEVVISWKRVSDLHLIEQIDELKIGDETIVENAWPQQELREDHDGPVVVQTYVYAGKKGEKITLRGYEQTQNAHYLSENGLEVKMQFPRVLSVQRELFKYRYLVQARVDEKGKDAKPPFTYADYLAEKAALWAKFAHANTYVLELSDLKPRPLK